MRVACSIEYSKTAKAVTQRKPNSNKQTHRQTNKPKIKPKQTKTKNPWGGGSLKPSLLSYQAVQTLPCPSACSPVHPTAVCHTKSPSTTKPIQMLLLTTSPSPHPRSLLHFFSMFSLQYSLKTSAHPRGFTLVEHCALETRRLSLISSGLSMQRA